MIVITGASRGIGRYLFTEFKEKGFEAIGTYNSTNLNLGIDYNNYYKVDITSNIDVLNLINSLGNNLSEITLINCAGISYNAFAHKADLNKWNNVINVNLIGTFNVISSFLPIMREQKYGRIINFSSIVTKLPTRGISAYAASKAGLIGLTKSLATENASKGVTVNSINLGYVNLGMGVEEVPFEDQEKLKLQIPLGRFCEPHEIYNTIEYIMKTEYVNGSIIDINGGVV
jgi:NAD(P)-dependent dehydrogenase (short-subunit alcohol dehydrogenase family)